MSEALLAAFGPQFRGISYYDALPECGFNPSFVSSSASMRMDGLNV
jgi:hypothetical protein